MDRLLNLDGAPEDPLQRLIYLGGVLDRVRSELDQEWQKAYYDARIQGMFDRALDLRLHSRKRAIAWTRHENNARGRAIRWGDNW